MGSIWGWGLGFSIHDVHADGKQTAISGPSGVLDLMGCLHGFDTGLGFSIHGVCVDGEQATLLALPGCQD